MLRISLMRTWILGLAFISCLLLSAQDHGHHEEAIHHDAAEETEAFDVTGTIMHHIADAHDFHVADVDGHAISIPLPVILYGESGLHIFMSSAFHHDDDAMHVVENGGARFVKHHGTIYYASEQTNAHGEYVEMDETHHALNAAPMDFSITKNVASMFLVAILLIWMAFSSAKGYKKGQVVPKGIAGFVEPIIVFLRDDVAKENIGEKKYERYTPYLISVFFFVWIGNMLGLVPFPPGGANLTGNIAFTMVLSVFTLLIVVFSGNKSYWGHIFAPPVPKALWPIMIPIEIVGIFTKPFALMIRLFANMTAGHIIILSLISLIFIFQSVWIAPASMLLTLFIFVIKVLVALLQAYIFALLTALFIGQAVEEHDHH